MIVPDKRPIDKIDIAPKPVRKSDEALGRAIQKQAGVAQR